jgi:hypothetical protein
VAWVVRREPGWVVVVAPDRPEVAFSVPWAVASSATLLATGFWHPVFAVGLPFLAATAVHEAAHAAAARWHHVGVSRVEVGLLEGRVWLVGQPPDRQWVHIVLAGPLAHAAFGVVLLPLGWWAWELVALGGLIALHGLGNLAPRVDGDRWSDGQVLAELWLSRLPPWVRGGVGHRPLGRAPGGGRLGRLVDRGALADRAVHGGWEGWRARWAAWICGSGA